MDLIGEERGAVARAAAWLDASRAELVGLSVLLLGATLATGLLLWQALGRPDLPEVSADGTAAAVSEVGVEAGADAAVEGSGEAGDGSGQAGTGPHGPGHGAPPGPLGDGADVAVGEVTVHVAGQVLDPGVVTLAAGARVADALAAAGGATADADLTHTNLARVLADGEHVRILAEGEEPPAAPAAAPGPAGDPAAGEAGPDGPIDLNRASASELETLPGIGPAIAARIVEHRERHGPFREPGDLRDVSGIGERRFQDLADRVHVG